MSIKKIATHINHAQFHILTFSGVSDFNQCFFFIYAVDENINQLRNVEKKITSFYLVISKVFYLTG